MEALTPEAREFIRRMPKAELHVHLEGSVYPETLLELARKHGRTLPFDSVESARDWFIFRDFPHFVEIYVEICNCLRDEEDYELITIEMARRAAAQNLRYMEVTFSPVSILNPRTPALPDVVISGLRAGAAVAAREHGVEMQFILDPVRGRTPEEVMALARWWADNAGDRLIGFGLGGIELGNPPSLYADAIAYARDAGARISLHAGETDGPASVRDALLNGAERIGHGVRSIEDEALVAELAASGIVLEISPTSNVCLGVYRDYTEHPFRALAEAGVRATVNSDDPPMFNTTLTRELEVLVEHFDYDLGNLVDLTLLALDAAFLPDTEKNRLRAAYLAEFEELRGVPAL
ncbi:MAG TPA: adenosine deaminase [Thermomicrobiales bacterium]|nr:adenosine deaminase [Thermomicrobiales bacterium]